MITEAWKLSRDMRVVAFLWHQGEHDAFERPELPPNERYDFYKSEFSNLVAKVREVLGRDFPIICGEFTQPWMEKNKIACNAVLAAMQAVLKDDGCGMLVSSAGAKVNKEAVGNGDILHFSRDGLHLLGKRYLEAFEKLTQK